MFSTSSPSSLSGPGRGRLGRGRGREGRRGEKKENEKKARGKEREGEGRMRLYNTGSWMCSREGGFMKRGNVKTEGQDSSG